MKPVSSMISLRLLLAFFQIFFALKNGVQASKNREVKAVACQVCRLAVAEVAARR